jgi:hypothetical protein
MSMQQEESFSLKGSDWPKEAIGINSFFFLEVCDVHFNPHTIVRKADASLL